MSDQPHRVQLSRKKGWRMPPNTVKVDRSTNFGNPYAAATLGPAEVEPALLVALFRDFMRSEASLVMRGLLPKIRGKNLACWCALCTAHKDGKPFGDECKDCSPCHSDVLLEIANRDVREIGDG